MFKYLALIAAGYLAYKWLIRSKTKDPRGSGSPQDPGRLEDEMILDPQCGAYFPKFQAVPGRVDGKRLLFCSEKCRDDYLAKYKAHDKG